MPRRFLPAAPSAPTAYARPARTTNPATADETRAWENAVTRGRIDAWCDAYKTRLFYSSIKTFNRQGEPSTRTSGVDKAVLGVLCRLMREEGEGCFPAAESDVAALAGVDENTAANSLRRLENARYIIRHPSGYGVATRYSLVVEQLDKLPEGAAMRRIEILTELDSIVKGDLSHPAYHARNLGKNTLQVYEYLLVNPNVRPATVSENIGVHQSNVTKHLQKLERLGMAQVENKRWSVSTARIKDDDDLHKVTEQMGAERSERRAAYEVEKELARQKELARLHEDLDALPENQHLFESDEKYQEALDDLNEQIAHLSGETAQHTRQQAQREASRDQYARQVAARFRGFLKARGITEADALNLVTGDREAGRAYYPLVWDYIQLKQC